MLQCIIISGGRKPAEANRPATPASSSANLSLRRVEFVSNSTFRVAQRWMPFGFHQLLEQQQRVAQRLQHPPHQRYADENPRQRHVKRLRPQIVHDALPCAAAHCASPMWCFSCTSLMNRLQKNPITSSPAMMYIVTL